MNDLADELHVTPVTIRSDLEHLEHRGIAVRMHGGAILPEHEELPKYVNYTMQENAERKRAIARCALNLVKADATIIIDAGSTAAIFSQFLHGYVLTVVTNSIPVIAELVADENISVIASGGAIRKPAKAMVGELARLAYQSIHVDVVFLGASGYSLTHGVTTANLLEADGKRAMMDAAAIVCLLADSTKYNQDTFAKICDWDRIDYFITDHASDEFIQELAHRGVQVITPENAGRPGSDHNK